MTSKPELVYKLKCSCNQYPWGKKGSESIAARLCQKQQGWDGDGPKTDFKIDEEKPYAEMWFGTYPVLPSYIEDTGENLQDVLDKFPKELVGEETIKKFGHAKLPYLPKVLSISKALPLQLHPNKELASKLHKEDPDNFTDPNHKPEIALALSEFEAFCGFKPLDEIAELLKLEPLQPFANLDQTNTLTNQQLQDVVKNLLKASDSTIKQTYESLISLDPSSIGKHSHIPKLAPRLASQYSTADPGTLVALITMNYLVLQAGESIYIPADGIHAYLSGDIIECMARSDNVLNTGFCPRAERNSVDLFCSCLTFAPHSPDECMLRPKKYRRGQQGKTKLFAPPLSEFDALETELKGGEKEILGKVGGPTTLLVTRGEVRMEVGGKMLEGNEGSVWFVAPGVEIGLESEGGALVHAFIVEGSSE